jgi:hypothetical protein
MHISNQINWYQCVLINKNKSLTINEDENEKTKRHVKIKIFDLITQAFYPIVFNDFVYQNQIYI